MDDDNHYGPNHLLDLHTAHTYSNADIVGKWANIVYLVSRDLMIEWQATKTESFGRHIPGATMFVRREVLARCRFTRVNRSIDSTLWSRMKSDDLRLYSTHRFNFIRVRHCDHTFLSGDESFLAASTGFLRKGHEIEASML